MSAFVSVRRLGLALTLLAAPSLITRGDTPAADADRARAEAFIRGLRPGEAVRGTIQARPDGRFVLVPAAQPGIVILLANSTSLSRSVIGRLVRLKLELTEQGPVARSVMPEMAARWSDQLGSKYPDVGKAVAEAQKASEKTFQAGATTAVDVLQDQTEALAGGIADALAAVPPQNLQDRAALLDRLREIRKVNKALYPPSDMYRPEAYRRIYETSRGTTALALRNAANPFCTGVLVARDALLTTRHCIEGAPPPDQLEARFNFETGLDGTALPIDVYPVTAVLLRGGPAFPPDGPDLDFALLRLGTNASGRSAGEAWPIQCLSRRRVRRDDPLYFVGHPQGGPRSVHDNAFASFPFQATRMEFHELRALVEGELAGAPEAGPSLQEFTNSYRLRVLANGVDVFENYSLRWFRQPTIGMTAEAFPGNSGSPVYNRRDHRIVGILFAGDSDLALQPAGWRAHEAVLPISLVIDQIERGLPAGVGREGLCVQ